MERLDWGIGGRVSSATCTLRESKCQVEIMSAKCVTGPWVKEKFPAPRALYNHLGLTVRKVYFSVMYIM